MSPEDADIQLYLGMTRTQVGKYELATESLEKAWRLDPANKEIPYDLGVAYYRAGNYAKALSYFTAAERAQPDRAMVCFYEGYIYYLMGKFELVAPPLNKAEKLDFSLAQSCQFYRAMSLMKTKNYGEAEREFQTVISTAPETELADAAKTLLPKITALKKQEKRLTIVPSISMQYDSNVTLQPNQLPAATKVANREDYRTVFHLVGEYQFFFRMTAGHRWGDILTTKACMHPFMILILSKTK